VLRPVRSLSHDEEPTIPFYVCPGCLQPLEPGDEYVVARQYDEAPGLAQLRMASEGSVLRFHRQHFRRRLGDKVYRVLEREIF
jgi:hypothetical protein